MLFEVVVDSVLALLELLVSERVHRFPATAPRRRTLHDIAQIICTKLLKLFLWNPSGPACHGAYTPTSHVAQTLQGCVWLVASAL